MVRLFDEHDDSRVKERGRRSEEGKQKQYHPSNPVTPIPRRASASSPGSVRVRSRYTSSRTEFQEGDETYLPTAASSATWQDEVSAYEIERHLSLLPAIDELDTLPPVGERVYDEMPFARAASVEPVQPKKAGLQFPIEIPEPREKVGLQFPIEIADPVASPNNDRGQIYRALPTSYRALPTHHTHERVVEKYTDICELTTNPPPVSFQPHNKLAFNDVPSSIDAVVEADTVIDDIVAVVSSLPFDIDIYPTQVEDVVDVALTIRARELLRHNSLLDDQPAFIHNPLDYIRWWLLGPNRLEFLCWLGGAVLLGVVMCMLMVMTGLGMGWMSFGHLVR